MKWVLVGLAALSVCAPMRAQSSPASQDSAAPSSAKASSSADVKSASKPDVGAKTVVAVKPDAASKPELEDVKPQPSSVASPLILENTGPVTTEDVVRGVAKELARQGAGEANGKTAGPSPAKAQGGIGSTAKTATPPQNVGRESTEASDAVVEFQPAPPGSGTASNAGVVLDSAQSKSSRLHGDLYGVTGADGHAAGGSVGATSKSGKTSVYVQSDQARSKAGQPQ